MKADFAVVADIVEACHHIVAFLAGFSQEQFRQSVLLQSAIIRQLEIIGEAARRLSADFRQNHTSVPWKRIVGMRDRLIHGYDDVDLDVVWEVARDEVPALVAYLETQAKSEG